jgi:hypothetical protein
VLLETSLADASTPALATTALLVGAAFVAGVVDAIAGGGGLVTLPSLLAAGLPLQAAFATNKGQASFGAVSSFASFWVRDGIDRSRAPLGFIAGFAGSLAGARVLLLVPAEPLRPIVLVLLLAAAGLVVHPPRRAPASGGRRATTGRRRHAFAPLAFALGFYDGFFGPGTGSLLIVVFSLVFGDSLTRASGNAKVVNLGSNLAALLLFAVKGLVLWRIAAPMAAANALGAAVGARLAVRRGDRFVRAVVLGVVSVLVLKMAYDLVRP